MRGLGTAPKRLRQQLASLWRARATSCAGVSLRLCGLRFFLEDAGDDEEIFLPAKLPCAFLFCRS